MKKVFFILILFILVFTSFDWISIVLSSNISSIKEIQTIGIPVDDFIGSANFSEVNFYEDDYNTKYLFPMQGMCITKGGDIAVIDNSYGKIHIFTPLLQEKFTFGKFSEFIYPTDIAFYNDRFYIADPLAGFVKVYDANGVFISTIQIKDIISPVGVAVNSSGIFISDYFSSKVFKISFDYRIVKSNTVSYPLGLFSSLNKQVYCVSGEENKIYVFDTNLNIVNSFGDGLLIYPTEVSVDVSGNVYVVDRGLNPISNSPKVLVFDKAYKLITTFGSLSNSITSIPNGSFLTPTGIAITQESVYVFDSGYFYFPQPNASAPFGYPVITRLSVFTPLGGFLKKVDFVRNTNLGVFLSPLGVSLDEFGNMWVLNKGGLDSSEVVKLSPSGSFEKTISKVNDANLPSLNSIYADKKGNVILGGTNQLFIFKTDGSFKKSISNDKFGVIRKITLASNYYFIVSLDKNTVFKLDMNFNIVGAFTVCELPSSIAFDSKGNAFIPSLFDNSIHGYDKNFKEVKTFSSNGKGAFKLYIPEDIAIDKDDNVYIANTENGRITVFTSSGVPLYETDSIYYGLVSFELTNSHLLTANVFRNVIQIFDITKNYPDYSFSIGQSQDRVYVAPSDFVNLYFNITNTGVKQDNYSFNVFLTNSAVFSIGNPNEVSNFSLLPNATKTVKLVLQSKENANEGDFTDVIIKVYSKNGNIYKSSNISVVVLKQLNESLYLDDTTGMLGSNILVPLYLKNPNGIRGVSFELSFEKNIVAFDHILLTQELSNSVFLKNDTSNGVMFLIEFPKEKIAYNTVKVGDIVFKPLSIGRATLSISNAKYVLLTDEIRDFENLISGGVSITPYLSVNLPEGYIANEQKINIVGKTTVECTVSINGKDVYVDESGNFSFSYLLINHSEEILIVSRAKTLEESVRKIKVFYKGNIKLTVELKINDPIMHVNSFPVEIDPGRGTTPIILSGWNRTLVPIRAIVEVFGGSISWSQNDQVVTILLDGKTIKLQIGNNVAIVDGKNVQIDPNNPLVKPIIINDRTMIPLRFVSESLGCNVTWFDKERIVRIEYIKP
ncbi:MAG: hypothetical protein K6343_03945 [Caldisericaceae bacterium]